MTFILIMYLICFCYKWNGNRSSVLAKYMMSLPSFLYPSLFSPFLPPSPLSLSPPLSPPPLSSPSLPPSSPSLSPPSTSLSVHACIHSLLIYRRYKSDIHQIQHQQRDEARRQQDIEEKSMFVGNDRVAHLYAVF